MTDEERKALLEKLLEVWNKAPHLRLCQLLYNMANAEQVGERDLFYYPDEDLERALDMIIESS